MVDLTPVLKTPFVDVTAYAHTLQTSTCKDFYLQFAECMEAYGSIKGLKKCEIYRQDAQECYSRGKQAKRLRAMKLHRDKLYRQGKIASHYEETPAPDSLWYSQF